MIHYYIELLVWLLAAYFIGCLIGAVLRKLLGKAPALADETVNDAAEPAMMAATAPLAAVEHESEEPAPGHAPMAPRRPVHAEVEQVFETETSTFREETVIVAAAAAPTPIRARMPVGISAPRAGGPDQLQRISGVGPKNEQILHSLGFYHFDQIAQWTDEQVEWVDGYLRFNGRIHRENWVEQCRLLAAGEHEEFARLYGTGGLEDATGVTRSGEKTRH